MKIIDRYLRHTITYHVLLVLGVTAIIDLMTSTLSAWSYDLKQGYQWLEAIYWVVITLPIRLYDLFPLITLIGCLSGLGSLANQSELTVLRASGLSIARITQKVLTPVGALLVLLAIAGEWLLPSLDDYATAYRARLADSATSTQYGIWHKEQDRYFYVSSAEKNGDLGPVTVFSFDPDGTPIGQMRSESGQHGSTGWQLFDVQHSRLNVEPFSMSGEDQVLWATTMTPKHLHQLGTAPSRMAVVELIQYQRYLAAQGLDTASYELALWNKLLMPAMALSLVLVAVSFIFGPLRSVSTGTRVFIGVMVGLVLKIAQNILGPSSLLFGFEPAIAALAPVLVTTLMGILLLRRVF